MVLDSCCHVLRFYLGMSVAMLCCGAWVLPAIGEDLRGFGNLGGLGGWLPFNGFPQRVEAANHYLDGILCAIALSYIVVLLDAIAVCLDLIAIA